MNYRNPFSIALLLLLPICNSACTGKSSSQAGKADTVVVEPMYKLYPTTNNWNFLKLNTADGRIWIVQYAINPNRSLEKASCHFLMTAIRKTAFYMLDS